MNNLPSIRIRRRGARIMRRETLSGRAERRLARYRLRAAEADEAVKQLVGEQSALEIIEKPPVISEGLTPKP